MKKHPWLRPLAMLLPLAVLVAACGGTSSDDDAQDKDEPKTSTTEGDEPAGDPEPVPGFDGTTINLGALTATSGTASVIGLPLTKGNEIYFEALNAEGGVAGKYEVDLDIRDTAYTESMAIQEYNASKDSVVMYTQILGTAIINAVLSQMEQDDVSGAPATLDADWIDEPNLIPIAGPYQIQAINGIDWFVKEDDGEGQKICTLTQDDPYGDAGQEGVDHAVEELGMDLGIRVKFSVGTDDFTTHINQLEGDDCEAVVLGATPLDAAGALGKAAQTGFEPTWLVISPGFLKLLFGGDLEPYATEHVRILSDGPDWGDESVPGMAQIVADLAEYGGDQEPDQYVLFGYNQARAVHEVLEKAVSMGDLSHEGILEAIASIDTMTFDGLLGDYEYGAPEDRNPPRTSSIFKFDMSSPTGMTSEVTGYESDAAKSFEFNN